MFECELPRTKEESPEPFEPLPKQSQSVYVRPLESPGIDGRFDLFSIVSVEMLSQLSHVWCERCYTTVVKSQRVNLIVLDFIIIEKLFVHSKAKDDLFYVC